MAIDFNSLSEDEKRQIKEQLDADAKKKADERKAAKIIYDEMRHDIVSDTFTYLQSVSKNLTEAKKNVFDSFQTLLELKKEVYGIADDAFELQQTHTFSNNDNTMSIIIGHNVIDAWDMELVNAGVSAVNNWLSEKTNEDNKPFVKIIRDLLRPNKDGVLKASRVLELGKNAKEIGDKHLIDAVDMIQEAYKPQKTSTFVKALFKDDKGNSQWLALSMSQA